MKLDEIRRWYQVREGYWFTPKLFGIGATPVTWQGWVLTLAFCAALLLDIRFLSGVVFKLVVGVALIAGFATIASRKTDGGWRWRWGSQD
jgi:hypothetical protein